MNDEYMLDRLVICGSVDKSSTTSWSCGRRRGEFGELVYANMDGVDPALARRSMELMATEVMPRVNAAIGVQGQTRTLSA